MARWMVVALSLVACAQTVDQAPDAGARDAASMPDASSFDAHLANDAPANDAPGNDAFGNDAFGADAGPNASIFPLHVSSDTRHLVDRRGMPFLLQGDSPWELLQNLSDADTATYLDDRRSRGVNAILIELVEHRFTPHTPAWANARGDLPFSNVDDFTTTQEDYFAHVDWVLQQAEARGILALLVPAYIGFGCGDEGWCAEMRRNGVDRLTQYGMYVGRRYRNQANIVWVEGGDYTPSTTGSPSDLDLIDAVARGITMGDGGAHLHTAHWARGTRSGSVAGITFPLGLEASYTAGPPSYPQLRADVAASRGVRPVFVIENRYESEGSTTRLDLRAQMYQPILVGAAGFFFGNDPLWFLGVSGDGNPAWSFGGGTASDWRAALASPGMRDDVWAGVFFRALAWETLEPDTTHVVMTSGYGTDGDVAYALAAASPDGRLAVAYLPAMLSPTFDLSRFSAPIDARWYDPTTGVSSPAGTAIANTGSRSFTPPGPNAAGEHDWALVLSAH